MKHRAAIIGCGRMGVGGAGWEFPYVYTHADAYLALKDRVELVALCDTDKQRGVEAAKRLGLIGCYSDVSTMLDEVKPDIVSVCTPNGTHQAVMRAVTEAASVKGVWLEKPCELTVAPSIPVQVNYCRRFCRVHRYVATIIHDLKAHLYVWARRDWTTVVHFADLARMMNIPPDRIHYTDNTGEYPSTNSYRIEAGKWAFDFRNGGCEGGFMETALTELLDGPLAISSPADYAIESEILARQLMEA